MTQTFPAETFLNRELSWLEFNARVLEEAEDASTPLLERLKFLAIFSSNLDEFFMVRVAGLNEQAFEESVPQDYNADGMRAVTQLERIGVRTRELIAAQYKCLAESVLPALAKHGIRIVPIKDLSKPQAKALDAFFREKAFPILTPMVVDPSHPRPRYHNRALYIAALLRRRSGLGPKRLFAVVQLPQVLPRLVPVEHDSEIHFVWLEDVIAARLPELFGGFDVEASATFRVTRDSDLQIIEQESDDMLRLIEERLRARRRADAVRLEIAAGADDAIVERIVEQEELQADAGRGPQAYSEVYRMPGPLDLTALVALLKLPNREELRDKPFVPQTPRGLRRHGEDLFAAIARRDILLHHPYDSFAPVVEFVSRAADDPKVLAIKQTLYRTSGDSPIIRALMQGAENGKHVTALVELQARFDEAANVTWARQLERSGVHVVYGFMDLKTHCKVSLVVRQEGDSVRRYVHLGTGNYNPATALVYTDLGLFTADPDIGEDVSALFNLLTGYSQGHKWRKLIVAPNDLHNRTIELIEEQAKRASKGQLSRIIAKFNALVDYRVVEALYRASQAGVPIELIVRGICCLKPGLPGISETIQVRSIVDRFLEHSRIFVFGPDDDCKIFLASADWMPRNFYRRVEVMFPIESSPLRKRILNEVIPAYLKDNCRARFLRSDGSYVRLAPEKAQSPYRCQEKLLELTLEEASSRSPFPTNGSSSMTPPQLVAAEEDR
ncbi:MAG: polyphosphate kinase 1 [Planctomycetota bacterium]|nr:MAG: polyphosphate kinase 1 [Planctomycetota bacterium]